MDRTERFYKIERKLREKGSVTIDEFLVDLGVSSATFKRDIEYLRDRLGVPINWDRKTRGYRIESIDETVVSELPGLWFSVTEIHSLLALRELIDDLGTSFLNQQVTPLYNKITKLLDDNSPEKAEITRRIKVFHTGRRRYQSNIFDELCFCLLNRTQAKVDHRNRNSNELTSRKISPQRMTFYRDNWYIDAWCHLRESIRCFAVDSIESVERINEKAVDVEDEQLHNHFSQGFGIFSGTAIAWARIQFTAARARWIEQEQWHPKQKTERLEDGGLILEVPYSDSRELVMEILKHGDSANVLSPQALRVEIEEQLDRMIRLYKNN
jgi:predicted DNA-binding transcriptional regulator YafY